MITNVAEKEKEKDIATESKKNLSNYAITAYFDSIIWSSGLIWLIPEILMA